MHIIKENNHTLEAYFERGRERSSTLLITSVYWRFANLHQQARPRTLNKMFASFQMHDLVPSHLLSEFKHAYEFHRFNTRNRDLLRFPFARTTKYQGSFRINGARTFNLCRVILELLKISLNLKVSSSDILNRYRAYKSRGDSVFSNSV